MWYVYIYNIKAFIPLSLEKSNDFTLQNQDASVEIYTLVESLVTGGPACGKLSIGDWIRSVNGTPIQLPVDVSMENGTEAYNASGLVFYMLAA